MSVRLGLVSYLNARPIGHGLMAGRQRGRFEIIEKVPSALADDLGRGALDFALLPSIEYARLREKGREPAIVPGIAIATRGPAASVLLFSRVPPRAIRTVRVDASSRTSVALLKLLFRRRLSPSGPDPALLGAPPDLPAMLADADAALLIGDAALFAADEHARLVAGLRVVDLGEEWTAMTGLPFVFAFWTGALREDSFRIVAALQDSLAEGLTRLEEISRERAGGDCVLEGRILEYLGKTIRYGLGADELRGLSAFYRFLCEERILDGSPPEIRFHPVGAIR